MLRVEIMDHEGTEVNVFDGTQDASDIVDFVSLIAPTTYGPPALIAPTKSGQGPRAGTGDRVLYINTGKVPMFAVTRLDEDDA